MPTRFSYLHPFSIPVPNLYLSFLLLKYLPFSESTPSQPQYVFWYHNERMVNYDTERGVQVTDLKLGPWNSFDLFSRC